MEPCIYRSQLRWTYENDFGRTPCDLELRTYKGDRAPTFQVSNYRLFGSGFSYWGSITGFTRPTDSPVCVTRQWLPANSGFTNCL